MGSLYVDRATLIYTERTYIKILQIIDSPDWAIGHLSEEIRKYNPHFEWKVLFVHPKHVAEHIYEVKDEIEWADVIDFQYWNTARQLLELLPELKQKKLVLTHHNEKDLLSADWTDIDYHVVETNKSFHTLNDKYPGKVGLIPLAINLKEFEFKEKPKLEVASVLKTVGYVGRIVPWKGLKEIAQACFELGYRLLLMGKFDKPEYWNSIPPQHQANIEMKYMNCLDHERKNFYNEIDLYVGYSGPGRETGPLGLMESMARGVPVLTTPCGIAADICQDHVNAVLTPFDDYEQLKDNMQSILEDEEEMDRLRKAAWNTIKNYTHERRAWEYAKVYHSVYSDDPLVSVIIPTTPEKADNLTQILHALRESDYKNIEVVLVCDQASTFTQKGDSVYSFPTKVLATGVIGGYNLARARNIGAIEAHGKYLLFCDNRMKPLPQSIQAFVMTIRGLEKDKKYWLFGNKGTGKKTFVENFSFIDRSQFIKAGMFNERIDQYGGMSQEVRERFLSQGFEAKFVETAMAEQISGSHMTLERRSDIVDSKIKLWKMGLG